MKIIILRHNALNFFKEAKKTEEANPDGEWRYFKFINNESVLGLYENTKNGIETHSDFFKYFLGQFTPFVESSFDVISCDDFINFCETLNNLLLSEKKILDLSVNGKWIWTVDQKKLKLSPKLQSYLNY